MNTTVSVENNNQKKWEPNREGSKFSEWLKSKKQSNKNIVESDISDQAAIILSKCIDPNAQISSNLNSTGLVIGQVQSGKTLSMTSVTAMAKDNGFGIVIIMSGSVSPLSFQTARRITKELKGRKMYRIINENLVPLFYEIYENKTKKFIREPYNNCRQILPNTYLHNGYIDILNTEILKKKTISGTKILPYLMDKSEYHDIDTEEDFKIIENKFFN